MNKKQLFIFATRPTVSHPAKTVTGTLPLSFTVGAPVLGACRVSGGCDTFYDADGNAVLCGNGYEKDGGWVIPLRLCGKNFCGGAEALAGGAETLLAAGAEICESGEGSLRYRLADYRDDVYLISPERFCGRQRQIYTLRFRVLAKGTYDTGECPAGVMALYSDGFTDEIMIDGSTDGMTPSEVVYQSLARRTLIGFAFGRTDEERVLFAEGFCLAEGKGTPYEEYRGWRCDVMTQGPLRGVGETRDELDLLSGVLTRRVGKITLTREMTYTVADEENDPPQYFTVPLPGGGTGEIFSDRLTSVNSTEEVTAERGTAHLSDGVLWFSPGEEYDYCDSVEEYTDNVLPEIWYPLAAPVTEEVTMTGAIPLSGENTLCAGGRARATGTLICYE